MVERHRTRRKCLILFNSYLCIIKSIYRKKLANGKYCVYLRFEDMQDHYKCKSDNLDWIKGVKRGDLVTLHVGNGGYVCIEKGNNLPQDGVMRVCEV